MEIPNHLDVDGAIKLGIASKIEIKLNGEPVRYVIEFNISEGWIKRHKTDENDNIVLNEKGDEIEIETLNGKVDVSLKE